MWEKELEGVKVEENITDLRQIREQFRYMFRSENSSGICSDQGTVQVYVQIREQFRFMFRSGNSSRYMFRSGNSSGICSDQRTV